MTKRTNKQLVKIVAEQEEEGGADYANVMTCDVSDLTILYRALRQYTPTKREEQAYDILLEELDMQLDCMKAEQN